MAIIRIKPQSHFNKLINNKIFSKKELNKMNKYNLLFKKTTATLTISILSQWSLISKNITLQISSGNSLCLSFIYHHKFIIDAFLMLIFFKTIILFFRIFNAKCAVASSMNQAFNTSVINLIFKMIIMES